MHFALLAVAASVALIARILYPFLKICFSPLRKIPGPKAAMFTDFWYFLRLRKGAFEHDNIELHRKHGEIIRYGPNRYSFCSQSAQKIIYGHGAKFPKSSWYATWRDPRRGQWSLFADQSIQRHSENRRLYQNMHSMSSLVHYEPFVDECADLFSQRLQELASAGAYVNMGYWLQCYAFDVIGLMTYSKRIGFLDRGEDVAGVMKTLDTILQYATLLGVYSWLHKHLNAISQWVGGSKGLGRLYMYKFTLDRIAEHQAAHSKGMSMEEGQTGMDFLTKFLQKHTENAESFTMYHAVAGCLSNMIAGSDTTGISLSAILYHLLKNPHTFQALREEVDARRQEGKGRHYITFKESQEMPYLQAVMKEALRMHPATGLPFERVVPAGGAEICGVFFPEGTIVGVNSWVAHRDVSVFGPDADQFKPERWLISDKEKLSLMERNWMPFGLGSRTCIGRHISILEMSKLIPMLVRDFDFTLAGHLQADNQQWHTVNYWFVKPRDFEVKVTVRQQQQQPQ